MTSAGRHAVVLLACGALAVGASACGAHDGAVAGGGGSEVARVVDPAVDPTPAPDGWRLVGLGPLALAVPASWSTWTDQCGQPEGDVVWVVGPASRTIDCSDLPTQGRRSLILADPRMVDDLDTVPLTERVDLGSVVAHRNDPLCHDERACDVAVRAGDALLALNADGEGAERFATRVAGTLQALPEGWTAVPPIELGTSVDDATGMLEQARLVPEEPSFAGPSYVTGTEPTAGTVVTEGTTVRLALGDG